MALRSRISKLIVLAFAVFAIASAAVFGWYGFRVVTELERGSWREPTTILDRNGEPLLELYGAEWRRTDPIVLEDLPDHVPNAFLAAEDVRFRSHIGVDPIGVVRAAFTNVRKGGIAEGGSTITQQLAKTRFLSAERTFTRKGTEAVLALLIEMRLSKDEILEAYLNDVYLGHRKGRTVIGLDEAARVYFREMRKEERKRGRGNGAWGPPAAVRLRLSLNGKRTAAGGPYAAPLVLLPAGELARE